MCGHGLSHRLLGFAGMFLLPIDIAHSFIAKSPLALEILWQLLYWITFMLTWFVDPLLQVSWGGEACSPFSHFFLRSGCRLLYSPAPPSNLLAAVVAWGQEYYAAGQFTVKGRLLQSLRANLIFYSILGTPVLGFIIYILASQTVRFAELIPFVLTLANTAGLLIIFSMMGYGLVEVPRTLWRESRPEKGTFSREVLHSRFGRWS